MAHDPSPLIYETNAGALRLRFPEVAALLERAQAPAFTWSETPRPAPLIDGRLLCSGWSRAEEAAIQAQRVPSGSRHAVCYGTGLGDLPRVLLARPELDKLLVVVLSIPVLRLALELEPQTWITDPRVKLIHGSALSRPWDQRVPHTYAAGDLRLAEASTTRLRDELVIDLTRRFHALQFRGQEPNDERHIEANERDHGDDAHVGELVATKPWAGEVVVVCAGGPSLDDEIGWLADEAQPRGARVVAVSTCMRTLITAGVVPDFCVVLDSAPTQITHAEGYDLERTRFVGLVYERCVVPSFVAAWRGPRFWAAIGRSGDVWSDGTVTHAAVDLAVQLGAAEVILLGADFCYAHQRTHVRLGPDSQPVTESQPGTFPTEDGHGRPVLTNLSLTHMRRMLERYVSVKPGVRWRKRGRAGVKLEGVPWME